MSEIKNCPFCGGEARVRGEKFYQPNVRRNVICTKCFSSGGWYKTEEEAIEKWNQRKPMQEIVERLEEQYGVKSYDEEDVLIAYEQAYIHIDEAIEIVKEVGGMNE